MNKFAIITLVFLLVSPVSAGNNVFTDDDLESYDNGPATETISEPEVNIFEEQKYRDEKDEIIEEQNKVIKKQQEAIEHLENVIEGPPRNLTGDSCDVLDFSSYKSRYAIYDPYSDIGTVVTTHNVTVRIKSKASVEKWIERFYIVAFFDDGYEQTSQLQENPNAIAKWVEPYGEYTGYTTFDGEADIVSLGCFVKEGL
jgi:hypothetical protein